MANNSATRKDQFKESIVGIPLIGGFIAAP